MALCYNRLWKLLIDRGMTRTQMRLAAGISTSTLAKLSKGEDVNSSILVKIPASKTPKLPAAKAIMVLMKT